MKKHADAQGNTVVAYSAKELAALPRLLENGREMTDAEITAAALEDEGTVRPLMSDDAPFSGTRAALTDIFQLKLLKSLPSEVVAGQRPAIQRCSSPCVSMPILSSTFAKAVAAGR